MTHVTTPPRSGTGRRLGRLGLVAIVVAMLAMWAYVVYLAVGPGRQPSPDRLEDPAFAAAAQLRCREALDVVAALPRAAATDSAGERATVIDAANGAFAAMVDDLDTTVPPGEDGELVSAWLSDWRTYLDDRARYAAALRDDPDARLLVTAKSGQHVTEYLNAFAADNDMPACSTPLDV